MSTDRRARLAVDIGGTFTDVVVELNHRQVSAKVLTTIEAPELGVLQGVDVALEQLGLAPSDVGVMIHGTTLATNALIERKGAVTAFLTTEGVGDILEMGFEKRYAHYDLYQERPSVLVPAERRFEIPERIAAGGKVLLPLDQDAVHRVAKELTQLEIEAVAVGFLHAYAYPDHERRVRAILAEHLGDVTICLSSEVCPEIREYERFSTTVANAYIQPLMAGYLKRLADLLGARGMTAPLFMMMSGGGLATLEQARRLPIRLVESGPAGGAVLAADLALQMGEDEVMAFDMGGTTAKVCLIAGGVPDRSRRFEVARVYRNLKGSGLPLRIPVIDMVEIGAGGGSIGRVDRLGRIVVGPDSAGADPGPACYQRGGDRPAVTDANVRLGRIDPSGLAGGKIPLDPALAETVLRRDVGDPLDLDATWAAAGMIEIVDENMANAARVHAIERGKVLGRHSMIAFGGSAPLHAARLAEKLGMSRVIVPLGAGVGSAIGFLRAPLAYEVVRSRRMALETFDAANANNLLAEMTAEAMVVIEPGLDQGVSEEKPTSSVVVDMRYIGQGHELMITLPDLWLKSDAAEQLGALFEQRYEAIYGVRLDHVGIEITTWSLTLSSAPAVRPETAPITEERSTRPLGSRDVYEPGRGEISSFALHRRDDLQPGDHLDGPAIVAEDQTSTVVPTGWIARIASTGAIVLQNIDPVEKSIGKGGV
ncbi:MAG: hydantoinase/oxoprolinase family protein [Geminicoccaceae bacterium]